ncbi:hypothetical protein NLG97_g8552 [Lecanicillium saksenae]|uniref:Uncharacterized protein n=1 Tax=Lecanicillium saksenae TaxID=468837 RepID=A0ACC1QIL3_9HYPO|nr:hypothetical protein NLG97_g8552 [Lecanicillium saksenae]
MSLSTLPAELQRYIGNLLVCASDLNSLSQCCGCFYEHFNPLLYRQGTRKLVAAKWAVDKNSVPALQGLKRAGIALNTCDGGPGSRGSEILHDAANLGLLDLINYVLDTGDIDINSQGYQRKAGTYKHGATPLYMAAAAGRTEAVRLLLDRGADPNAPRRPDRVCNPLVAAIWGQHDQIARMLITAGADVTCAGEPPVHDYPIIAAVTSGNLDMATLLLEAGVDLYTVGADGRDVFVWAFDEGNNPALLEMLLSRGARTKGRYPGSSRQRQNELNDCLSTVVFRGWYNVVKMLLDEGADVNSREFPTSNPLLIDAIRERHFDMAELFIQRGADVNARSPDGCSALHYTSKKEHLPLVKALLAAGADVSATNDADNQPLRWVECAAIAKLLVENGADCNYDDGANDNALKTAVDCRRIDVARVLLEAGAHVSEPGGSDLLYSACVGSSFRLVELLLDYGVNISAPNGRSSACLSVAAGYGSLAIVKLLLDRGVDANSCSPNRWMPLRNAACTNHLDVMDILIRHGADIENKTALGNTVLLDTVEAKQAPAVEFLIAKGADIEAKTAQGANALILASSFYFNEAIVDVMLRDGRVDVNIQDMYGRTALLYASMRGRDGIVEKLLDHQPSADVSLKDFWGATPLSMAVRNGHARIVQMLLAAQDKSQPLLAIKDEHGRSIIDWARRTSNGKIWRMLAATPEGATVDIVEDSEELMMHFVEDRCFCDICGRCWVCKEDGLNRFCYQCGGDQPSDFCLCRFCEEDGVRVDEGGDGDDDDDGDGEEDGDDGEEVGEEAGEEESGSEISDDWSEDWGESANEVDDEGNVEEHRPRRIEECSEEYSEEHSEVHKEHDDSGDVEMEDAQPQCNDILDEELYLEDFFAL